MNFSKSARYALYAALEMARADGPVTVGSVAAGYRIPEGALAKVLQNMVRAGIAQGVRGIGGGYLLARPASNVSVLDVLEVFDPPRSKGDCLLSSDHCSGEIECRLRSLFDEVDEMARCTFASVTLDTLVRPPALAEGAARSREERRR